MTEATIADAFTHSYSQTDADYVGHAGTDPAKLFSGACAIGCYVDLHDGTAAVGNLGDCRAVAGVFEPAGDGKELFCIELSEDQAADKQPERRRIHESHPGDDDCVVDMNSSGGGGSGGEEGAAEDWRVKRIASFTRSIGDLQLKELGASAAYNLLAAAGGSGVGSWPGGPGPRLVVPMPGSTVPVGWPHVPGSGGTVMRAP